MFLVRDVPDFIFWDTIRQKYQNKDLQYQRKVRPALPLWNLEAYYNHHRYIRKIPKIFWPVQISNQELWARAKQKPIELEIRQSKWGWLGHTLRRPPGDIAKAALEWNPQGTRSCGRPRTTWRRTILEEIRHQGKTWNEVKVLASNRVRWRNFVRVLCSLQEWRETIYTGCPRRNVPDFGSVPYVKVYRYNPKHLYPKLNGYGDNGQRSLKLWQLLHTYWLPNTY